MEFCAFSSVISKCAKVDKNAKIKYKHYSDSQKMDEIEPQSGGVFADIFPAEWAADGSGLKLFLPVPVSGTLLKTSQNWL